MEGCAVIMSAARRSHPPCVAVALYVSAQQNLLTQAVYVSDFMAPLCLCRNDYSTMTPCRYLEIILVIILKDRLNNPSKKMFFGFKVKFLLSYFNFVKKITFFTSHRRCCLLWQTISCFLLFPVAIFTSITWCELCNIMFC